MADQITQPRLGALGWARFAWRQLTSMRTALFLLLLLAVGAVPGSIWPQRSIDAARTADYIAGHPELGPWLDRLGFFDVYASPWFAAIYLLLFVSLVGCVLPRTRLHWRAMRSTPPRAPARPERLAASATTEVDAGPSEVLAAAHKALQDKRFRTHSHDGQSVSAEKGYLKETGNLVFHLALILVITGVAVGHLFGWKGDVIVPVGKTFGNALINYDTFSPGPWVDPEQDLSPFRIRVDEFEATFEERLTSKRQFGQPRDFTAHVTVEDRVGGPTREADIKVNHPLEMDGAGVFLLGNGYAPVVTVRDEEGTQIYSGPVPFLAQDNNYTSVGAIKVTGASPRQLGLNGFFLPTSIIDDQGPRSVFPDAKDPALVLTGFEGTLFPGGRPQSVYTLDTSEMTQLETDAGEPLRMLLRPGQTFDLPGDRGSITFDRVERFAGLSIRHDPGRWLTLAAALLALAGLVATLVVRRRRVFVRVRPGVQGAGTVVTVAGLAKADDEGLEQVVADVLAAVELQFGSGTVDHTVSEHA
jgi:cytochrome c biogenesis protein